MRTTTLLLYFAVFLSVIVSANATSAMDEHILLSSQGFGPVKIGMTLKEASEASGYSIMKDGTERIADDCYSARFAEGNNTLQQVSFMVENDKITVIDIHDPGITTLEGVHVGMTAKAVKKIFHGQWQPIKNIYGRDGDYNIFVPVSARYGYMFNCEDNCDDMGKIASFMAGNLQSVQYVEGCS